MDELKQLFETSKTTRQDGTRQFLHSGDFYNIYTATYMSNPLGDDIHTHPYHEIFVLLDGGFDYTVNKNIFSLSSGDSVIISSGTPHCKSTDSEAMMTILVIELAPEFFEKNECPQYEKIFNSNNPKDYKLSVSEAKEKGIYSIYKKLLMYCADNDDKDYIAPLIKSLLIEYLYLLNTTDTSNTHTGQSQIQQIIEYINNNYKNKISLEEIADRMFITKNHLCTMFKKHTGDTVKGYITKKRLAKTKQLTDNGHNISKACLLAGFPDYSAFYRAFLKANGKPPKDVLK